MKSSLPSRLFFVLGILLWIPIAIGVIAMVHIGHVLALLAATALGISFGSIVVSTLIRKLL